MLERIAAAMDMRVSLIVALAESEDTQSATGQQMSNMGENDLSEESIQVRRQFRSLTPDNQRALLEIAKVLNRLQRGEQS